MKFIKINFYYTIMGIFTNIFRRGLDIPEPAQSTGKVMTSPSSPTCNISQALLYYPFDTISALKISAVYAALSIISDSIATLPIYVKQIKDNEKTIVKNSKNQKLFYNMLQSKHIVIKQLIWDLLLYGNSFLYIKRVDGKPEKLIYMQHGDVQIDYKKQEDKVQYLCSNHKEVPAIVKQEDMLHFAKDTFDGVQGRGFMTFADDILKLAGFTQSAAANFFGSGCNLTGILQFSGRLRDEQKEAIRQQWMQIHANGAQGGGLGVIEGDAQYIPISQNSSDAQMLDTREFNVIEIARYFNISPVLLGDLSHNSYGSIEDSMIQFVTNTLLPIINLVEEECNRKLLTNPNQYFDFDESELLKGNKTTMSGYYTALVSNGIMTTNEAREQIGLNPVDGGDALIIPFTKIEDNTIGDNGDKDEENSVDSDQQ